MAASVFINVDLMDACHAHRPPPLTKTLEAGTRVLSPTWDGCLIRYGGLTVSVIAFLGRLLFDCSGGHFDLDGVLCCDSPF